MKSSVSRLLGPVVATFLAVACGDRIAGPSPIESSTALRAATGVAATASDEVVLVLKRTARLDRDLSASAVIGPRGGSLQLDRAGVRIDFAPGAVRRPTRITITAKRGANVAYEFQPHGLVFSAPVTVRQSLRRTAAENNEELAAQLQGSYYQRLLVDRTGTFARNHETRRGRFHRTGRFFEFPIEHFSGYIVSTGRMKIEVDVDVAIETH